MKLKCNHNRRVMVLPSGNTIHRSDGIRCYGDGDMPVKPSLTLGGNIVKKVYSQPGYRFVTLESERN